MQAATVVINRRALRHNLQHLRDLAPASKLVAVVKANAYGHGLLETARTLPDADAFGVARLEEALRLRAGGIPQPILLLEGFFEAADLPVISAQRLHTAVHSPEQLAALEEADLPEPVTVWMKLDTGMHRLGVLPEQAEAFYQRLSQCKNVRQPVNIVSHFARADEPECGATERQLDIFTTFTEGKPGLRSIAASGGILLWPQSHFDWARPGIILYGVSPLDGGSTGADFGCQPVMSLTSSLIAVREHKAGEPVDRVKEVIGDVIRGLERDRPGPEKTTLPDDPQFRRQEAAIQQVASERLQRERLQAVERDMVRDLNREKTLGGD